MPTLVRLLAKAGLELRVRLGERYNVLAHWEALAERRSAGAATGPGLPDGQ